MNNFKRKFFMFVLTFCAIVIPAVCFAGCDSQGFVIASNKEAKACFIGASLEKGFYVEIEYMNNEEETFNAEDFTYEMNGETKKSSGIVIRERYSSTNKNGEISIINYFEVSQTLKPDENGTLKIIVEGQISKLFYKGKEITKNKIF